MTLGNKTLDDLLKPISKQLGRENAPETVEPLEYTAHPVRPTDGLDQAALVDMFADEASKVRVSVHRCSYEDAAATISEIVGEEQGSVVLADDTRLAGWGIYTALQGVQSGGLRVWDAAQAGLSIEAARTARYGVTVADAAIAETGTIVQEASEKCGRAISLLPLVHIALVEAKSVKATMADVTAGYDADDEALPSQLCFISGPSATADIELVRVEGVHGPMYVHYIVLE